MLKRHASMRCVTARSWERQPSVMSQISEIGMKAAHSPSELAALAKFLYRYRPGKVSHQSESLVSKSFEALRPMSSRLPANASPPSAVASSKQLKLCLISTRI